MKPSIIARYLLVQMLYIHAATIKAWIPLCNLVPLLCQHQPRQLDSSIF
ncbi:hypothetical protein KSS87_021173, partial [Heliosperma pusillum]